MKLIDALKNVIRTVENQDTWLEPEKFGDALNVSAYNYDSDKFNSRLKAYWIHYHCCTDTWVGFQALYFDDELVGCTDQEGRKCDYEIKFLDKEAALRVKEFLKECADNEIDELPIIIPAELDEEISETMSWPYAEFLLPLDYKGTYNGVPVTFDETARRMGTFDKIAIIVDSTGEKIKIDPKEYVIRVHVK
jgi:hypothetical protein